MRLVEVDQITTVHGEKTVVIIFSAAAGGFIIFSSSPLSQDSSLDDIPPLFHSPRK